MKQKDIKILWGRSGNKCAKCKAALSQDPSAVDASYTLGQQAHIVGEKAAAARGKSPLNEDERNSYHNLILLCPTCHVEVDSNEADWPIEKLHQIKSVHELWVSETLSSITDKQALAENAGIASLIDGAVEQCQLGHWREWSSWALGPSPQWKKGHVDSIYTYRQSLVGAIWPEGMDEFKRASLSLAILLHRATEKFIEHADLNDGIWRTVRFYKLVNPNPNYDRDVDRFEAWLEECYAVVYEATKAANWFADVIRRDINPMFFREAGKFVIEEGPYSDLSYYTRLYEFSEEEKMAHPQALFDA